MWLFEFLIYAAFAFTASWLAWKSYRYIEDNNLTPNTWDRYLVAFILFFSIIGGVRWKVGVDWAGYAHMFAGDGYINEQKEYLWNGFVKFFNYLDFHWTIGMCICSLVQILFVVLALKSYRWLLIFVPYVLFGGRYWFDCMNGMRQMIVACAFLWAVRFIIRRQLLYYILFIAIAMQIHQSAIFLAPAYLFTPNLSVERHRWILIGVFVVCIFIGLTPDFTDALKYVDMVTESANYEKHGNFIKEQLQQKDTVEALTYGPMMWSYMAISLFIIWYGSRLKERFAEEMPEFNIWFNFAYLYGCLYFLVCNVSHLFIRPVQYLELFQMAMASILLYYFYSHLIQKSERLIPILYFFTVGLATLWSMMKVEDFKQSSAAYKTFFTQEQYERWKMKL